MRLKKKTGIILALDVMDKEKALEIAEELGGKVDAIKVGYPLVLASSIEIMEELSERGNVIADFKIADIPYISGIIAEQAFKNGAGGVIVHGFVGKDTVKACVDKAMEYDGEVYVVTELSSVGGKTFMAKHSEEIVEMAEETGARGIVAPATRPERIMSLRKLTNLKILCPGVGAQGGRIGDVFRAGADFIIVGRSIYSSENPEESLMNLIREISEF